MFTFLSMPNQCVRALSLLLTMCALVACSEHENLNRAPQFPPESSSLPPASENAAYNATIQATDQDGDVLSYSITDAPVGLEIKPATGELTWTPTIEQVGLHTFTVTVTDTELQSAFQEFQVEVLNVNVAPQFSSSPSITSIVEGSQFRYQATAADADLGSDPLENISYSIVNGPEGMTIDSQTGQVTWTPSSEQVGTATVLLRVQDREGLLAEQAFSVEAVGIVSAQMVANPRSGLSPLTVRFSSAVENNNLVITKYEWDFDNDGVVDRSDAFGAPQNYSYNGPPGSSFEAQLVVTPVSGDPIIATQTITIINDNPVVEVTASVTNGHAPLSVDFTVTSTDTHGVKSIEIDFDGDGSYDEIQTADDAQLVRRIFQRIFSNEGSFSASVRVTDAFGAETVLRHNAITVDVNNPQDPIITLSAAPESGPLPLTTQLAASAQIFDGSSIVQWEWDVDGDGNFETVQGSGVADALEAIYEQPQLYYPVVKAVTDSGRSSIASIEISPQVSGTPTLFIGSNSDTIDPDMGEVATIDIGLPFATDLELWIEDPAGVRVATIQSKTAYSAGEHSFEWGANDNQNTVVTQGDYYAVLAYDSLGKTERIDLRDTTGGVLSYFGRTKRNPRFFDRLEGPLRIDYEVDEPAEITFFWQISFDDRLMTLLEHERQGRGGYSLYWNGEFPNGKKVPESANQLLPGILRYHLPDNVIYVREAPRIADYQLKSTIIADPRREPIGLDVTISKATNVELVISDMDKGVNVATRYFEGLPAGLHELTWDGKNDQNQYLAPGDYRLGVRSIDDTGHRSLFWYRTQRVEY